MLALISSLEQNRKQGWVHWIVETFILKIERNNPKEPLMLLSCRPSIRSGKLVISFPPGGEGSFNWSLEAIPLVQGGGLL